jgi:hypothetical protein
MSTREKKIVPITRNDFFCLLGEASVHVQLSAWVASKADLLQIAVGPGVVGVRQSVAQQLAPSWSRHLSFLSAGFGRLDF